MKRLALAVVALAALAVAADAAELPKAVHLVNRMKVFSTTHFVRGAEKGSRHGGGTSTSAEARATTPTTPAPAKPEPAKAD